MNEGNLPVDNGGLRQNNVGLLADVDPGVNHMNEGNLPVDKGGLRQNNVGFLADVNPDDYVIEVLHQDNGFVVPC